jgi:hypothetical protein
MVRQGIMILKKARLTRTPVYIPKRTSKENKKRRGILFEKQRGGQFVQQFAIYENKKKK